MSESDQEDNKSESGATIYDRAEPDYQVECENCGAVPTVTLVKDNMVIHHTGLCGPCCWGEADCIDPDNWN